MSQVTILDKDPAAGEWTAKHLREIGIEALAVTTVARLLAESEHHPPAICLIALRSPVSQVFTLIQTLTQEPRFTNTTFILMGPIQHKHAAFESGADDFLTTPPDVIELRKRVRLYLDRAEFQARLVTETRITQEIDALGSPPNQPPPPSIAELEAMPPISLLEHAAALTEQVHLLDHVLRYAGEAISLIDIGGTVVFANPAWERLTGCDLAALREQVVAWPPTIQNPVDAHAFKTALAQGETWHGEANYTLPDGTRLDVEMTVTPVLDSSGDPFAFVIVQRDVAERKALDTLKTRFIADAAAELRAPVTNIKMRQYLLRQSPPDQNTMHLQALERETDRLSDLIDAMLELSRLDAGIVRFDRQAIDLIGLVADIIVHYNPSASEKGVTLALRHDPKLPLVQGDQTRLARAVGILVDNAIQYTPEAGHVEISLSLTSWAGRDWATIQVNDTGIGISPDDLSHLFGRFFRSERVRDSGVRGVGLGLPIAQELVKRHGGNITVESQINAGSTFTIWLPVGAA